MKLNIMIETLEGGILIDRSYFLLGEKAPNIKLQDLVDDAMKYLEQRSCDNGHDCHLSPEDGCKGCDVVLEARRLVANDKAND